MASSSANSLLSVVQHYQRSIENCQDDEKRLMHCINKLYNLPIKVEHLQDTGIGKTVNSLRRLNGEISVAAQTLVTKWKAMVAADEEPMDVSNCHNSDEESNNGNGGASGGNSDADQYDHNRNNARSQSKEHKREEKRHGDRDQSSSRSNNTKENKDRHSKTREDESNRSNKKHSSHHQQHEKSSSSSSSKHKSGSSSHNHEKRSRDDAAEKRHKSREKKNDKSEHHHKEREHKETSRSEKKIVTPTATISHHKSSTRHREERSSAELIEPKQPKEKSEHTREKHGHYSSKNKDSDLDKNKDKDKREHQSKSSSVSHTKQKQDSIKSSSNEKDKRDKNNSKHSKSSADASAENKSATPPSTSSSAERKRRRNNENDDITRQESNSAKKSKTQKESKNQTAESLENVEGNGNGEADDGIDSSMGANFADVLGMLNIPTKKSKKSLNNLKSPCPNGSAASSSKHGTSATPSKEISNKSSKRDQPKPSTSTSPLETKPDLLSATVKLQPLDPSIALALPAISNNYKPMPLNQTVMDCVFNTAGASSSKPVRTLTDAEALSHGISSKTMRTKIYSGARTGQIFQVPTLFDLCIRILQKNIDALEYTGGVPFEVLRSVLDRASPQQLLTFEEYNPYVIGDSDVLWQQHCQRNYRSQRRQEFESWREMYLRCQEDQERKLSILAENIKKSQKESEAPIRKTQLAFVDSMVKPPRNVQRKQEQFGTKAKLIATPAARVAALSSVTPNAAKTGDTRLRIAAATRDPAQVSHAAVRPKKAPLMAKTLQFMRGRNKR